MNKAKVREVIERYFKSKKAEEEREMKKYIYTKPMCGACIELKKSLDLQGIKYEERSAARLEFPEDEVDREAFLEEVVMRGKDPKAITLPIEYNYEGVG